MHIRSHTDLVCVCEDDPLQFQGEQDIQKENLVAPDDALLLRLTPQPTEHRQ